jgi:cytosine/adenosine deaminase-related metal-dependent hydrolase
MRTKLQGGVVVGFNGQTHVLIRDGMVVWEDDRIIFVGKTFTEAVDRTIQAADRLIIPGLINLHWHAGVRATSQAATDLKVPIQIHTGQNLLEFHQTLRKYRRTPVELLDETGMLGPRTTLSHCIMVSGHPQAHCPDGHDLDRIVSAHANVAHCPVSLARRGMHLHHLTGYLNRGINIGLGTDIHPFDLIREMRAAGLICKVAAETPNAGTAREVFNAATLGGAQALGRDDLGRLCPGAKADLVIINQRALHYGVVRDPIRSQVDCGVASDVETVIVDGQTVMDCRYIPSAPPLDDLLTRAQAFAETYWTAYPQSDWNGRAAGEAFPNAFTWEDEDP